MASTMLRDRSAHETYLDLFDRNGDTKPEAIAVKAGGRCLTYSQLRGKVYQLANFLVRKGATPGTLIGIAAERSLEMIVSLLAVHMTGAAYVPLDPTYPADRLGYMIEDTGLRMVVGDRTGPFAIPGKTIELVDLNGSAARIASEPQHFSRRDVKPEGLAYVIYTSGSTGRPKGVMVTQANLMNFVRLVSQVLPVEDDDVYLQSSSITYAVSVRQIFVALSYGLRLVIASSSAVQDPVELFRLIRDEKITLVDFVPSHWRSCIVVLKSLPPAERVKLLKNSLRRIVTIGEPLLPDLPTEWRDELHHPARLVNIFGQTETTGLITSYDITGVRLDGSKVVSIGRPIPETRVHILDPDSLEQAETGEIGELCVSNPCVARGYLNNPDLTASKFVPDPFDRTNGRILYRTGDLARFSPDGTIEYLGRTDQQIKVRGMRIELGEIESVILKSEAVREAVVVPQTRVDHGKVLVAFLTTRDGQHIDRRMLRESIKANLPSHMVPVQFVVLPELPRNPNGKIDRKELMQYRITEEERVGQARGSLTDGEQRLLAIWNRLLKTDTIQTTDDFFDDLGGDSLLAVILFIEIEKEFGRNLPISTLYRAPTIERMARLLEGLEGEHEFHSLVPIKEGTGRPLFLVHGASGNILIYHDLARQMPDSIPIYGLQSYGLGESGSPLMTIEDMASAYVREVMKTQPSGPYFLGGYCMGGTVALEMAQQLRSLGHDVDFLGMFETYNWGRLPHRPIFDKARFLGEKALFHWKNFRLLSQDGRSSFLSTKLSEVKKRSRIWAGKMLSASRRDGQTGTATLVRQSRIWKINDQACFKYQARYYDGRITVFLPRKKYSVHSVPEAAWDLAWAKQVDEVTMPCYPAGMLVEPFVQELAKNLEKKINAASESAASASSEEA